MLSSLFGCINDPKTDKLDEVDTTDGKFKPLYKSRDRLETPNQKREKISLDNGRFGTADRSSVLSLEQSNQRNKERATSFHPADINWSEQEIKHSRSMAVRHINIEQDHVGSQEYDFTKDYRDPLAKRPGIDFVIGPKFEQEAAKNPSMPCSFGKKQTPINFDSQMPVLANFQDKNFKFHYEQIEQNQTQLKFNQVGDQFFVDIAKGKSEQENFNCLCTQTISLFDPHIPQATLHGVQFHFHAPSEHSIDGKLLDMEMHIVHLLDNKREHKDSQFFAGVLGFFFKVMPEEYFEEMEIRYPQADIEWHDRFLIELVHKGGNGSDMSQLDLKQFVKKVDFNKRWTYSGSLTTAPCDEGILWNVVEGIIPIRQSTLDMYNEMRKVEASQVVNKIADADPKNIQFLEQVKAEIPDSKKSRKEGGNTFMRVAGCNRKVQDINGRAVYRIDLQE